MSWSCYIFDLDGTLSNPLSGMADAINHALQSHGYQTRSHGELAAYVGPPLEHTFEAFVGNGNVEKIHALIASYREHYLDRGFRDNHLYNGIEETLLSLKASGARLGVCTSKPQHTARKVLDWFSLTHHFSFVSGGDVGVTKQSQLQALLASGEIDTNALMIGDRAVDITAAHANGLASAGVRWGFGSDEELRSAGAVHLLEKPADVLQWLGQTRAGCGDARPEVY